MPLFRCSQTHGGVALGDNLIVTNGSYGYKPTTKNNQFIEMNYSKDFSAKIRYMPRINGDKTFCLLGTATSSHYQPNPTIEIRTDKSVWGGISANNSSWQSMFDGTSEVSLLDAGVVYDAILTFTKATSNFNFKVFRVSDNVKLFEINGVNTLTPYQPNFQNDPICIGGIARQSRFIGNDNMLYDFGHSYFENDGNIVWGTKS